MVSYVEKNRDRAAGKLKETAQPNSRDISRQATHEVHGVEDEKVNKEPEVEETETKAAAKKRRAEERKKNLIEKGSNIPYEENDDND